MGQKKRNSRSSRKAARQQQGGSQQGAPNNTKTALKDTRTVSKREWFPGGGFSGSDFLMVVIFVGLWAVCGFVEWFICRGIGLDQTISLWVGVILGFFTTCFIWFGMRSGPGAGINMSGWGDPWSH